LGSGQDGGAGGDGVLIIRYLTADAAGLVVVGGTTSTSGGYTIHTIPAGTGYFVITTEVTP
jgi:hypothetical protein